MHRPVIDPCRRTFDAEAVRRFHPMGGVGGGEQRFRRHAAVVQAVTAHPALLHEHHRGPHLHRARGHGQPAGAGADDADVAGFGFRHAPAFPRRFAAPPRDQAPGCAGPFHFL